MRLAVLPATLLTLLAGDGRPELTPSAFALRVEPSTLRHRERALIRVERAGTDNPAARRAEGFDLYLVSIMSPTARYLTPAGAWSQEPVPLCRGLGCAAGALPVVAWPEPGPPGWLLLGLVTVRGAQHPLARESWLFQPAQVWVMVRPARVSPEGAEWLRLIGVTLATIVLAIVLARYPTLR